VLRPFFFGKGPLQRCQSSCRRDHSLEASTVNLNVVRNSSALVDAPINLFDRSHPILQSFHCGFAFPAHFQQMSVPNAYQKRDLARQKFGPSVNFCETFVRRPGSNLATTRHVSCGTGSSTLCVNQFLYGARSSVSPRRGPLLAGGRCSRRRAELHARRSYPAHQPARAQQTN